MFFSIITPTNNSAQFLETNLESVLKQRVRNIEHIFIDNKSNDQTLQIINKYKKKSNYSVKIVSKEDKGIYYAFNKGLKYSKGKYITILNSDDYFAKKTALKELKKILIKNDLDFTYSNIKIVDKNNINKILRFWKSEEIMNDHYYKVPHPSFFVKNSFLKKNKIKFNTIYKISSDLDFIISCFKYKKKSKYLNKVFVAQRSGGTSQKFLNVFKANIEVFKLLNSKKMNSKIIFIFKKIYFKLCQLKKV